MQHGKHLHRTHRLAAAAAAPQLPLGRRQRPLPRRSARHPSTAVPAWPRPSLQRHAGGYNAAWDSTTAALGGCIMTCRLRVNSGSLCQWVHSSLATSPSAIQQPSTAPTCRPQLGLQLRSQLLLLAQLLCRAAALRTQPAQPPLGQPGAAEGKYGQGGSGCIIGRLPVLNSAPSRHTARSSAPSRRPPDHPLELLRCRRRHLQARIQCRLHHLLAIIQLRCSRQRRMQLGLEERRLGRGPCCCLLHLVPPRLSVRLLLLQRIQCADEALHGGVGACSRWGAGGGEGGWHDAGSTGGGTGGAAGGGWAGATASQGDRRAECTH